MVPSPPPSTLNIEHPTPSSLPHPPSMFTTDKGFSLHCTLTSRSRLLSTVHLLPHFYIMRLCSHMQITTGIIPFYWYVYSLEIHCSNKLTLWPNQICIGIAHSIFGHTHSTSFLNPYAVLHLHGLPSNISRTLFIMPTHSICDYICDKILRRGSSRSIGMSTHRKSTLFKQTNSPHTFQSNIPD